MFSYDNSLNRYLKIFHEALGSRWSRLIGDVGSSSVSVNDKKPQICSVVIVGAGMAGLGAARELIASGISDILILEAQEKVGGRVCTIPFQNGVYELGAQWIHGEDNPIYRLAHKYNLLSDMLSYEGLGPYLKPDGTEICSSLVAEVSHKISCILEECEKFVGQTEDYPPSVGQFLKSCFEDYLKSCEELTSEERHLKWELFHWHEKFQEIDNSCSNLETLSAKDWGKYHFTGGKDCINFSNGYSSVIDALVQDLPKNIIHVNCPVRKISINESSASVECEGNENCVDLSEALQSSLPVTVTCEDGSEVQTRHVIVTSSVGYLKAHHGSMFEPHLPEFMVSAIEAIGFGVVDKIFLFYEKPWWNKNTLGFQIVHPLIDKQDKELCDSWWLYDCTGFDVLSEIPAVLIAWVGGEGAIYMEQLPEGQVAAHCTDLLQKSTNIKNIPLPLSLKRSQWFLNPYIKGGYSHTTITNDKLGNSPKTLSQPVCCHFGKQSMHPAILLAGEAVHEFHFSTTHGAFESGQSQARVIVDYWKDKDHQTIC